MTARPLPEAVEKALAKAVESAYQQGWMEESDALIADREHAASDTERDVAALRAAIAAALDNTTRASVERRMAFMGVERAVAEEREATLPLLCDAVLRVQSCIERSAELEKEYADGGYTEANAVCRRQREEDEALLMRMDAAIRARGGAK